MSVWLDPARRPFYAGTYFPARDGDRGAGAGFLTILNSLADVYRAEPGKIADAATSIVEMVRSAMAGGDGADALPGGDVLTAAARFHDGVFDSENGGVRGAPKFPSSLPVRALLRRHHRTGDAGSLRMAERTLERMAARRHARSTRRRLPPLLDRQPLAGAALREDALRQRIARARVRRGLAGDEAPRLRAGRAHDARLPPARDDVARRRVLLGDRRRLRRRRGRVLRLERRRDPRPARRAGGAVRALLRRHAGRQLRGPQRAVRSAARRGRVGIARRRTRDVADRRASPASIPSATTRSSRRGTGSPSRPSRSAGARSTSRATSRPPSARRTS